VKTTFCLFLASFHLSVRRQSWQLSDFVVKDEITRNNIWRGNHLVPQRPPPHPPPTPQLPRIPPFTRPNPFPLIPTPFPPQTPPPFPTPFGRTFLIETCSQRSYWTAEHTRSASSPPRTFCTWASYAKQDLLGIRGLPRSGFKGTVSPDISLPGNVGLGGEMRRSV
jgi:hypothetical protein